MGHRPCFSTAFYNILSYFKTKKIIIAKFLIVSGSAVLLNLLLLYLMVHYWGLNSSWGQNVANAVSMELSIVYNFFLSRNITWKGRHQEIGSRLFIQVIKFHMAIGITLLFRLGLFAILQLLGVQYLINAIIGIAISSVFNFLTYDTLIFKKEES